MWEFGTNRRNCRLAVPLRGGQRVSVKEFRVAMPVSSSSGIPKGTALQDDPQPVVPSEEKLAQNHNRRGKLEAETLQADDDIPAAAAGCGELERRPLRGEQEKVEKAAAIKLGQSSPQAQAAVSSPSPG